MSRPTLHEFRHLVLDELIAGGWLTASEITKRLGHGGDTYYRVALVLERLAHQGHLELRDPRSGGHRYFRLRQASRPAVRVYAPPRFDDDDNPFITDEERAP